MQFGYGLLARAVELEGETKNKLQIVKQMIRNPFLVGKVRTSNTKSDFFGAQIARLTTRVILFICVIRFTDYFTF